VQLYARRDAIAQRDSGITSMCDDERCFVLCAALLLEMDESEHIIPCNIPGACSINVAETIMYHSEKRMEMHLFCESNAIQLGHAGSTRTRARSRNISR
jgi:hypothetical protein